GRAAPRHLPGPGRPGRGAAPRAQEARLPHPRRPRGRAQEVRAQEGPQGAPVLQALTARRGVPVGKLFGTDGVRGLANADLTPELALALGRASVGVLLAEGSTQGSGAP